MMAIIAGVFGLVALFAALLIVQFGIFIAVCSILIVLSAVIGAIVLAIRFAASLAHLPRGGF